MATLRLGERPWDEEELPDVCMKCGAPADVHKNHLFRWHPGWVFVLILVHILVYVIVALALTKKRRVRVPLCHAHRHHWVWRQVVLFAGFAVLVLLGFGAMIAFSDSGPGRRGSDALGGLLCGGTVVGLIVWLILVAVLQSTAIRPGEITDRSITLLGVSKEFVRAYEEQQDVAGRIDELARERWGRGRGGPPRRVEESDRVRPPDEDETRRAPPDAFQEE
jgi:hypothetical protein